MSNIVEKVCISCKKKFETSKFTPYVVACKDCKGKKVSKKQVVEKVEKVEKDRGKSAKATKPGIKARAGNAEMQVISAPMPQAPKVYVPVENKEAIFLHLLRKGYKLSGMNTPYKVYPKIKVMCPLSDAFTKIIVNYLHGDGKFDGSNILMTKKDAKDLPKEVREELSEIIDLVYPETAK